MRPRLIDVLPFLGSFLLVAGCGGPATPTDGGDLDTHAAPCRISADCDDGLFCSGVETCTPGAATANARGCVTGAAPCGTATCDEATDHCGASCATPDADGDGSDSIACGGADCDDTDRNRFPGHVEVCDTASHDEDCDPRTFGFRDGDSDTYADFLCCNTDGATMHCGTDCDDAQPAVHPTQVEACNRIDDDCDGVTDEAVQVPLYADADGDMFGTGTPIQGCPSTAGYSTAAGDCDDAAVSVNPAAVEGCGPGMINEDCDASIDEGCHCVDGSTPCGRPNGTGGFVTVGDCTVGTQTCASGVLGACSGNAGAATETMCDAHDEDCDGMTDEGLGMRYWPDNDGDGWGEGGGMLACAAPTGSTTRGGDCFGFDVMIHPGAVERCNGLDDDCDGARDQTFACRGDGWDSTVACTSCGFTGISTCGTTTCAATAQCWGGSSIGAVGPGVPDTFVVNGSDARFDGGGCNNDPSGTTRIAYTHLASGGGCVFFNGPSIVLPRGSYHAVVALHTTAGTATVRTVTMAGSTMLGSSITTTITTARTPVDIYFDSNAGTFAPDHCAAVRMSVTVTPIPTTGDLVLESVSFFRSPGWATTDGF